ncbi:hypothetical protein QBZ16_005180 [Prototheca wickerhamii]|uniref:Nuclear pore localisation protein NPL4 C-terminal domain-containing protein n=1 Tax=Prototheca wickerhamii TaxID=3111 RepID=A0AAD9MHK1_PROWI|nr:hypothetical protein QBZ16_005180 [Prototheca wickerhamii]
MSDGLERVKVDDVATLGDLYQATAEQLGIPQDDMVFSLSPSLLTVADPASIEKLEGPPTTPLASLGVGHGAQLFLRYSVERSVQGPPKSVFESRPFGAHMDVARMVALQTRIERQESPDCPGVSFDGDAIHAFQLYVSAAIAFSIKRGGILYGTVDEDGTVRAHAIYEPPQTGSADSLSLERGTEEESAADAIAAAQGWKKVGWIYSQSTKEREFIVSTEELCQMAACQDEMGDTAVTALVAAFPGDDGQAEVHVEAFQVSRQCVKLWREGWFQEQAEPSGLSTLRDPKDPKNQTPVIVAGKDQGEVDNDYFLIPARSGKPFVERIADFHLLLYLARQPSFDATGAVAEKQPIGEGYKILIESLAGL